MKNKRFLIHYGMLEVINFAYFDTEKQLRDFVEIDLIKDAVIFDVLELCSVLDLTLEYKKQR